MIAVTGVIPIKNGLVKVSLSDGRTGVFDIKPYCSSEYFKELLQDDYFRAVHLFFRGIGWPRGQDIGPDTIAEEMVCSNGVESLE
jgi:hypothetical protein